MKYYIGIDGGGTKTQSLLIDENGVTIGSFLGGASNFLVIGTDKVNEHLKAHLDYYITNHKLHLKDLAYILLGTTGAGRIPEAKRMSNAFIQFVSNNYNFPNLNFEVVSDARIALEGAFSGKTGAIFIAGTGSIMFGKNPFGEIIRLGGFGRYLGDEGSGYTLGNYTFRAMAKYFDGRAPKSRLTELFIEQTGIDSGEKLITEVYSNNYDIPQVAPVVLQAADEGDLTAKKIIETEATEILSMFSAMGERIGVEKLKIAFIGSIITNDTYMRRWLIEKVKNEIPQVEIIEPENQPAYGAYLMAKSLTD